MTVRNAATMGSYGASWIRRGYGGCGNVEPILDTLKGRIAIVCGSAEGVFEQFGGLLGKVLDPVVFAANDTGCYLEPLDHWATLHVDNLPTWISARHLHRKGRTKIHSISHAQYVDYAWELLTPTFALSGYFAMQIAYLMGAERIILCGCPGEAARRFFDVYPRDFKYGAGDIPSDKGVIEQIEREMARLPDFKEKVRSTSGWTKDFFGGV